MSAAFEYGLIGLSESISETKLTLPARCDLVYKIWSGSRCRKCIDRFACRIIFTRCYQTCVYSRVLSICSVVIETPVRIEQIGQVDNVKADSECMFVVFFARTVEVEILHDANIKVVIPRSSCTVTLSKLTATRAEI